MNFGFSGEMIFLFFLALILFGPKKLPEIGRQIGRIMNEFRRASNEFRSQIESEINTLEVKNTPQILPPIKEPLGSLASRIFNPPPAEQLQAAEAQAEQARAAEARTEKPSPASPADADNADVETGLGPSPASPVRQKVAPDA